MSENENTVVPEEVYGEMTQDTPGEPDEKLRAAAQRAQELVTRREQEADQDIAEGDVTVHENVDALFEHLNKA